MSEEKKDNTNLTLFGVAGLVGVTALGVLGYIYRNKLFGKKEDKETNNDEEEGDKEQGEQTNITKIWLRKETKPGEKRTALTPDNAKKLIEEGYSLFVERCDQRIFKDQEYLEAGCKLVGPGSWRDAPKDALILGLKELPENDESPLEHTHIFFAHCFKGQAGWKELIHRFVKGKGNLLDLEFLKKNNRRVAAFGKQAGMVGAAVTLINWAHQQDNEKPEPFPQCHYWENKQEMVEEVKKCLGGRKPKAIVFGALGRSGRGAVEILKAAELEPTEWDLPETKDGGPFEEVLEHDIMFNCILLLSKIPPFVTKDMLDKPRKLSFIGDVSCDNSSPNNPIPFFNVSTTLKKPVALLHSGNDQNPNVYGVSIDHLPTLLPRESSTAFSDALFPYLVNLKNYKSDPVWLGAEEVFKQKVKEASN